MSRETRVVPKGLVTEPSRILGGDGGLIEAQNVVCRRPGLMEPRGGIPLSVSLDAAIGGFGTARYAREWRGETWFAANDGSNTRVYHGNANPSVITVAGENANVRAGQLSDRQAWTFDGTIRMLDNENQTAAPLGRLAGAPRAPGFFTALTSQGTTLPADSAVAYRCVVVRHPDLTGGTGTKRAALYGPPSDRVVVRNTNGTPAGVIMQVPVQALRVGDEIQIYRSSIVVTPATATPDDEMRLCLSYLLQASDITAKETLLFDFQPDGQWNGPALYTNVSQEGAAGANYRPYVATDAASYNAMTFWGGIRTPYQKTISLNAIGPKDDLSRTLCSVYSASGQTTAGSNIITGVPVNVFQYLAIGQLVNEPSVRPEAPNARLCPGGVRLSIVAFDEPTQRIFLSGNAGTTSNAPFVCWDFVGVSGPTINQYIYAQWIDPAGVASFDVNNYDPANPNGGGLVFAWAINPTSTKLYQGGAFDMERAWSFGHTLPTTASMRLYTSTIGDDQTVGISLTFVYDANDDAAGTLDYNASNAAFYVVSTKALAFNVAPNPTSASIIANAEQDGNPGRLAWSKVALPESQPLPYFTDIGDPAQPIVRIIATSDRLWIFKTDGLWCATGTDPLGLVIQQVDPTLRMIKTSALDCSGWATRLGDTVYVWAQGGIFAVDSGGVRRVDDSIETYVRSFTPNPTTGAIVENAFSTASLNDGLVAFGFSSGTYAEDGLMLVYHAESGTWATWTVAIATLGFPFRGSGVTDNGSFLCGSQSGFARYVDSPAENTAALATNPTLPIVQLTDTLVIPGTTVPPVIATVVDDVMTITPSPAPIPLLGCMIRDFAGAYFLIVEVIDATTFRVDRDGMTTGTAQAIFWAIDSIATYSATTEGDPMLEKHYGETLVSFQNLRGGLSWTATFRKRGDTTAEATTIERRYAGNLATTAYQANDRERQDRLGVPTDAGRQTGVEIQLRLAQACRYFALDALVLTYTEDSTNVGRGEEDFE